VSFGSPLEGEFDPAEPPAEPDELRDAGRDLPGPTRPDKISIWPVELHRFGIDVLYHGAVGFRRADQVQRQLTDSGVAATLRQEHGDGWIVRFGPVERTQMLTVLNGFVW
jgi:hypothetical protein